MPSWRLAGFAAPGIGTGLMGGAVAGILPTVYVSDFGVDMAFVGLVLLVSRLFDAVTDPIIGFLSDLTSTRFGRRRVWVLPGCILFAMTGFALLNPPQAPGNAYFFACYLMFYLAGTMIEIPHSAWAAELSRDPKQRTRIITFKHIAASTGTALFALAPLAFGQNGAITPQMLSRVGAIFLVGMPILGLLSVISTPDSLDRTNTRRPVPWRVLRDIWRNAPFRMFIGIFLIGGVGFGMFAGLYFLYIQTYLLIGDIISVILIMMVGLGFVSLPLWMLIVQRIGKRKAWAASLLLVAASSVLMVFIEPGEGAKLHFLALLFVMGICGGANTIVPYAMQADIVDYDTLRSGEERAGSYYSMMLLIVKINYALGAGLGMLVLGLTGYDAAATTHSPQSVFLLKICAFLAPSALMALAAFFVLKFPLSEKRNDTIRRRIEMQSARRRRA